jgi:hypothetical protein
MKDSADCREKSFLWSLHENKSEINLMIGNTSRVLHPAKDSVTGGYFFEGFTILISTFCVCTDGSQDLS